MKNKFVLDVIIIMENRFIYSLLQQYKKTIGISCSSVIVYTIALFYMTVNGAL